MPFRFCILENLLLPDAVGYEEDNGTFGLWLLCVVPELSLSLSKIQGGLTFKNHLRRSKFFLMEFDRAPLEVSKTCGWPRSAIILSWSKLQSYIFQPHPFSHFWKHSGPLLNAFQVLYPGKFAFARCSRLWGRQRYLWFVATMCSSRIIPEFIKNSGGLTFKNHLRRSKFFFWWNLIEHL